MSTALALPAPALPAGPSLRRLALLCLLTIGFGFGGLIGWAALATLDSAVPAPGSLVTQSKRKTLSLLDSGLLRELLVAEGDAVRPGQVLLRLDDTQARALLGQARVRNFGSAARASRLHAELSDAASIIFAPDLLEGSTRDAALAAVIQAESDLFAARRDSHEGTIAVQRRRIGQLTEQIIALDAQRRAFATRLDLTQQELRAVNSLLASGFATRNRQLELRRTEAQLQGEISGLAGREAEARQVIAQTELEILSLANTRRSEAARELQDTVAAIADGIERARAAEDLLRRTEVTAPEAGTITEIRFHTPGSSIGAGQPVLDIVPADDRLLVEGAVRPFDIERVQVGQRVNVRLTAFSHRRVPPLPGRLVYVGADRQVNAQGTAFFVVRAELDAEAAALLPGIALNPGMPAEMLVLRGERTALDYFLSPLLDSMRRALREN
jgi:HlyD family secretion protein